MFQFGNFFFHPSSPKKVFQLPLDDKAGDGSHSKSDGSQAEEDENDGEHSGPGMQAKIDNFSISNRRQSDHSHVQAVEKGPFVSPDDFESDDTDKKDRKKHQEGEVNPFFPIHEGYILVLPIIKNKTSSDNWF